MSRPRAPAPALIPSSSEARLRAGLAAASTCLALALALVLIGVSLLRGTPRPDTMLVGIALGLCAELLCLDLAVRHVCRRLDALEHEAGRRRAPGRSRAITATAR